MYSFIRMNTLYLKTNEADVINANKTEFTYFLKHPIILNEDYILHVDNYCYNGGGLANGDLLSLCLIIKKKSNNLLDKDV